MNTRVLIVEDHPLVSSATRDLLLSFDGTSCVSMAATADEALIALDCDPESWDLVLLDLDLPGAQGLSLARRLADAGWAPKICIVTALSRDAFIAEAKTLGVRGFLSKASPLETFSEALRQVLAGSLVFPDVPSVRPSIPRLTRQQRRVLELLATGLTSKQVARRLSISEGTVNNHVNATLRALGARHRLQAFRVATELGLIDAVAGSGVVAGLEPLKSE
jgi:DNA-binding NarL/FixJ family response regulator